MNPPAFADLPRARSGFGTSLSSRLLLLVVSVFSLLAFVPSIRAVQLLPGVYGYGLNRGDNTAGFGPGAQIIEVTSLENDGPGTFREAVQKELTPSTAPRIIVFKRSGVINLKTQVKMDRSNVTVAGQTAPYPGIALHGAPLVVVADKILIQHLRMRAGDRWNNDDVDDNVTTIRDSMYLSSGTVGVSNVVFDHCTFAWSLDELVSGWNAYDNVTFNKCIFAEPLHFSTHIDENMHIPNRPQQAQALPFTASGTTTITSTSAHAMEDTYHLIQANGVGDYVDYTLTVDGDPDTNRNECAIGITGITGNNRGRFRVYVYDSNDDLLQTSNEYDQYAAPGITPGTPAQIDFIARESNVTKFTIPMSSANRTYRIRVQVTGKATASQGYQLGIDQLYITQPHAMGPYFSDGKSNGPGTGLDGKLTMIGNVFAHMQARGPWVGSQNFYFANNVLYHRRQWMLQLGVSAGWAAMKAAVIGNTFMEGRSWSGSGSPIRRNTPPTAGALYYVDLATSSPTRNKYDAGTSSPPAIYNHTSHSSDPTEKIDGLPASVPLLSTDDAYADAILNAGARPNERDEMELRVIDDIAQSANVSPYTARQGDLKNSVLEAGGWPEYAENLSTWLLPDDPNEDDDNDGYTNIEEWLEGLSQALLVSPSDPPTPGALQAEVQTLTGGAVLESTNPGHVGSGYVNFMVGSVSTPSAVTFPTVAGGTGGTRILRFRNAFSAASSRTGHLVINGGAAQNITFAPTGSFKTWRNHDVTVTLASGNNTVSLRAIGNDLANLDEMAVFTPAIYQGETATYSGGAFTESVNAGHHGTGYVNFLVGSAGSPSVATYSGIAGGSSGGARTLRIRYALGSATARTGQLVINSETKPITFLPTGAFTTWSYLDIPITLNAGINTIAFRATGQDLGNIDELLVY